MSELMNGVTCLYTIPAEEPWSFVLCTIIGAVVAMLIATIAGWINRISAREIVVVALILSALGGVLGWFVCRTQHDTLCPERYAVTVSESVNVTEFCEKYEIVEQKGNAYIIQIKENENG